MRPVSEAISPMSGDDRSLLTGPRRRGKRERRDHIAPSPFCKRSGLPRDCSLLTRCRACALYGATNWDQLTYQRPKLYIPYRTSRK